MLPADERLTRRRDFAAVYAKKRSWAGPFVVLYVLRREHNAGMEEAGRTPDKAIGETRRWGFSVSKKVGKAHDRNRVKRRLRDICVRHGEQWERGFDGIFVARSASATASYAELEAAVCQLVRRAGLIRAAAPGAQPND